ncbi:hypothetical protein Hanom_Chr11g00986631 [Helianthus anomalus]
MELRSRMKMSRFQTFWIKMQKNKPLDESRKTSQTSGTKMAFYSNLYYMSTLALSTDVAIRIRLTIAIDDKTATIITQVMRNAAARI